MQAPLNPSPTRASLAQPAMLLQCWMWRCLQRGTVTVCSALCCWAHRHCFPGSREVKLHLCRRSPFTGTSRLTRLPLPLAGGRKRPRPQRHNSCCSGSHRRDCANNLSKRGWPSRCWGCGRPVPSPFFREGGWNRPCCWGGERKTSPHQRRLWGELPCSKAALWSSPRWPARCARAHLPVCSSFRITPPSLGKGLAP